MHYKNGEPVEIGDIAKACPHGSSDPVRGTVIHTSPGSDYCNMTIAYPVFSLPAKLEGNKFIPLPPIPGCAPWQPNVQMGLLTTNAKDAELVAR